MLERLIWLKLNPLVGRLNQPQSFYPARTAITCDGFSLKSNF